MSKTTPIAAHRVLYSMAPVSDADVLFLRRLDDTQNDFLDNVGPIDSIAEDFLTRELLTRSWEEIDALLLVALDPDARVEQSVYGTANAIEGVCLLPRASGAVYGAAIRHGFDVSTALGVVKSKLLSPGGMVALKLSDPADTYHLRYFHILFSLLEADLDVKKAHDETMNAANLHTLLFDDLADVGCRILLMYPTGWYQRFQGWVKINPEIYNLWSDILFANLTDRHLFDVPDLAGFILSVPQEFQATLISRRGTFSEAECTSILAHGSRDARVALMGKIRPARCGFHPRPPSSPAANV